MPVVKVSKRPVGRPAIIQQPLIDWTVDVGTWAIAWMSTNKRVASGKSINSFVVDIENKPTVVELKAAESVKWALEGRNAGGAPPIHAIENWMIEKKGAFGGLDPLSLSSIAWAIRTKIAKEGTNQPRLKRQNVQLVIKSKGKKHLKKLGENVAKEALEATVKSLTTDPNFKKK